MVTEAQKQELIAAIQQLQDEKLLLEIKDLLALAEARARGAAKPRAYPGFGGEAGRALAEAMEQYEREQA
ncbi:MAG: hypothetical protein ACRYFX_27515 [Janthinobacterium lividum]